MIIDTFETLHWNDTSNEWQSRRWLYLLGLEICVEVSDSSGPRITSSGIALLLSVAALTVAATYVGVMALAS